MEQAPKPVEAAKPKSRTMLMVAAIAIIVIVVAGVYFAFFYSTAPAYAVDMLDDGQCATGAAACKYNPLNIDVPAGQTVTWINRGNTQHTVHSCTSANSPTGGACPNGLNTGAAANLNIASSLLNNGDTFAQRFDSAGTYMYYCDVHRWMNANVTVT